MKQASAAGESNKFGESGETYGAGESGEMEELVTSLTRITSEKYFSLCLVVSEYTQ